MWPWSRPLKVEIDEFDLDDLSKVTNERVEDAVDSRRVDGGEIDGTERTLRLAETLEDQTVARWRTNAHDGFIFSHDNIVHTENKNLAWISARKQYRIL